MNKVILIGRLTKDIELKKTQSGASVTSFTVAVNRAYQSQDANQPTADFINCVIWRQQAENLANWAKKGALIGVTGRIQTRNYENQQGQRVYVTEVVADSFQMLESRSAREGMGGGTSAGSYSAPSQSTNNTPRPQTNNNNATPNFGRDADPFGSSPMEISDDDLPF